MAKFPAKRLAGELAKQPPWVIAVVAGILLIAGLFAMRGERRDAGPATPTAAVAPGEYLFAWWNVENLFDEIDDPKSDDDSDDWFGRNPAAVRLKLDRLSEAILRMNLGRGPDILAMCEVENDRALAMLQEAINARCDGAGMPELKYPHRLIKEDRTGRGFAPALLSRLPIDANRARKPGGSLSGRMLVAPVRAPQGELIVFASHWTSRVTDKDGAKRMRYAQAVYGEYREIVTANPTADVIVCGDFNDDFADPSIRQGLNAVATPAELAGPGPRMLDLCGRFDLSREGTLAYRGKWNVFDHVCVSPGMLDNAGWACDPDSAAIFRTPTMVTGRSGEPREFGNERWQGERGYSDHFAVLAKLSLR